MSYLEERRNLKLFGKKPEEQKRYRIPAKSEKKKAEEAEAKKVRGDEDPEMEKWHQARRKELTGTCQCGCGRKSSKHEDRHFRSSNAHILPKVHFKSVALHPLNHVERSFWDGCHATMDTMGMERWVNFADWDDIKAKFKKLEPLVTPQERTRKDFKLLKNLVEKN